MTIKSENILKVIQNFKKVLPMATCQHNLNMSEPRVKSSFYECGTIHCHGGWYAIAVCDLSNKVVGFMDGANAMAKDLGLNMVDVDTCPASTLAIWAKHNPILWGNEYGGNMFGGKCAFTSPGRPYGAENISDIIDHWEEVYARVKALEEIQNQPIYANITAQLAVLPAEETSDLVTKRTIVNAGHS